MAVPVNVTTPLFVVTEMSVSFNPESAAIAAFTLPVVIVSLSAPVAFPEGPGAIAVDAVLGDEVSAVVALEVVDGELVLPGAVATDAPELLLAVLPVLAPRLQPVATAARAISEEAMRIRFMGSPGYLPCVVPLALPDAVPLVVLPEVEPGAEELELLSGDDVVPEAEPLMPVVDPVEPGVLDVDALVLGEDVVSVDAVLLGDDVELEGADAVLGVVLPGLLEVVLLRSQAVTEAASAMAAAMGIRRFMTSPVGCV